jgi:hypothetical protein
MPSFRTILNLLALGSVMVENPMPQRVIANAIRVVALVVMSTLLAAVLLVSGLAFGYQLMIHNGIDGIDAALYCFGVVAVITVIVVYFTVQKSKTLLTDIGSNTKKSVPLTTHLADQATDVVDAFVSGFLSRYKK